MVVKPRGGCDPRNGHGLKDELEGLMEAWRHMFQDDAGDSVWARCFVVWGTPESLVNDSRGDAARDLRGCVLMLGRNVKVPWEQCSVRECGVRRHGLGLKFLDLRDNLRRVHQEVARGVVPQDREVRWEGLGVLLLRRGA